MTGLLHRGGHGVDCPPSCEVVEKGEGDEDDEKDASDGWDIYSWGHLVEGKTSPVYNMKYGSRWPWEGDGRRF